MAPPFTPLLASGPSSPQDRPARATDEDITALLSGPALRHLEPRPGGQWNFHDRAEDTILVSYTTSDGLEPFYATVHLACDPGTATSLCYQHVYNWTEGQPTMAPVPIVVPAPDTVMAGMQYEYAQMQPPLQTHAQAPASNNSAPSSTAVQASGDTPGQVAFQAQVSAQVSPQELHPPGMTQEQPGQNVQPMNMEQQQHTTSPSMNWTLNGQPAESSLSFVPQLATMNQQPSSWGEAEGENSGDLGWATWGV
ncbi:mating type MAT1-2-3 [Fusarium albosuccineum]|uniref:Mating type MAT1-2-3 n=1 Tax=Fusarium albosuccineum TaxID=1237068 RepID=A0A8H4L385_9HYPO|nr:mating type MAT1-2-3 [Fusarium albosuccineum]KAF4986809.1 hypothetical protein FDECE_15760 [Fusarium decemcellulare]